jgi:hypothetical protein
MQSIDRPTDRPIDQSGSEEDKLTTHAIDQSIIAKIQKQAYAPMESRCHQMQLASKAFQIRVPRMGPNPLLHNEEESTTFCMYNLFRSVTNESRFNWLQIQIGKHEEGVIQLWPIFVDDALEIHSNGHDL